MNCSINMPKLDITLFKKKKNCSDGSIAVYNYDFNVHLLDCYLFEYSIYL